MAEGRTNRGIARRLCLTERTVETHVAGIMSKLALATGEDDHRRVLAVITYLGARTTGDVRTQADAARQRRLDQAWRAASGSRRR